MGRFISPDTIVPEPGSSGGFNRYRYTRNNPLRYTDPSGHQECEDEGNCELQWEDVVKAVKGSVGDDIGLELIQSGVPSTFGVKVDVGFSWDRIVGTDHEVGALFAYNWYSNEFGLILDGATGASGGTPQGLAAGVDFSGVSIMGPTNLDILGGPNKIAYGTASADSVAQVGATAELAFAVNEAGNPIKDFGSDRPVVTTQVGLSLGINGIPNVVDARAGFSLQDMNNASYVINSKSDFNQFVGDTQKFFGDIHQKCFVNNTCW